LIGRRFGSTHVPTRSSRVPRSCRKRLRPPCMEDRTGLLLDRHKDQGRGKAENPRSGLSGHQLGATLRAPPFSAFTRTAKEPVDGGDVRSGMSGRRPGTGNDRPYRHQAECAPRLPDDRVMASLVGPYGTIWGVTRGVLAVRARTRSQPSATYHTDIRDQQSLPAKEFQSCRGRTTHGNFGVGTLRGRLGAFRSRQGTAFRRYASAPRRGPSSDRATALAADQKNGKLWGGFYRRRGGLKLERFRIRGRSYA